jgi:hypothetical protein
VISAPYSEVFEVETVTVIPCPTEGCGGRVHAAWSATEDGTDWEVVRFDADPIVLCSRRCTMPEDLVGPVESVLRARMSTPAVDTPRSIASRTAWVDAWRSWRPLSHP